MTLLPQFLAEGITIGAVYAFVAVGWVLIYNVSGVLNLAQGEFVMLGALLYYQFTAGFDLPMLIGAVAAVGIVTATSVLADRAILRRLTPDQHVPMILATLGISIILREVARLAFGPQSIVVTPQLTGAPITVLGATVLPQTLLVWGILILGAAMLAMFFSRAWLGKGMRACQQSLTGAWTVGIDPLRMRTLAFAIAAILGAVAGIIVVPLSSISWAGGTLLGIKGFVAAVLGGFGTLWGAVLGGIVLGLLETMAAGYVSSAYKDAIALGILIMLLLFKPSGLLGTRTARSA